MKTFIKTLFKALLVFIGFFIVVLILTIIFVDTPSEQVTAASTTIDPEKPKESKKDVLKEFRSKLQNRSSGSANASVTITTEEPTYEASAWRSGFFVDNFGDRTNEKYIETEVDGVFSNSATVDSYLFVELLFKKDVAGLFLHEYGRNSPTEKFIGNAQIQMKNSIGEKITINTSQEWNHSGGIAIRNSSYIKEYSFSTLRNFLKRSTGKTKVVVFDDYSSEYLFEIDVVGFSKEFDKL